MTSPITAEDAPEMTGANNTPELHIRMAQSTDYPAIIAMGEAADMGTLEGFEDTLVAEMDNEIAGFCRIRIYDGVAHVNPIVVAETLRGMHIGERLMHAARGRYGELRFVARGYAVGFYEKLGCMPCTWEDIAPEVASDCDGCTTLESCKPFPMRLPSA